MDGVLFVDDDEDLRIAMCDILEALGFVRVVTAASLAEVQTRRDEVLACQLAILDINLGTGEPTGVMVHDWLRHEGFRGAMIFLTGHASDDPRVKEAAKLDDSLIATKPLTVPQLRRLITGPSH